jgi:hypothetical protein
MEVKLFSFLVDGARLHVEKEEDSEVKRTRGSSKEGRAESGECVLRNAQLEIEKKKEKAVNFSA